MSGTQAHEMFSRSVFSRQYPAWEIPTKREIRSFRCLPFDRRNGRKQRETITTPENSRSKLRVAFHALGCHVSKCPIHLVKIGRYLCVKRSTKKWEVFEKPSVKFVRKTNPLYIHSPDKPSGEAKSVYSSRDVSFASKFSGEMHRQTKKTMVS